MIARVVAKGREVPQVLQCQSETVIALKNDT